MKKTILSLASVLFCAITFAQSVPQGINYQAVARDANGTILTNHYMTLKASIYSDTVANTMQWQELHTITTNDVGIFAIVLGNGFAGVGSVQTAFANIDWNASTHYIKIELDHGSGFMDYGTTALQSVPYALAAETADIIDWTGVVNIPADIADGDDVDDADNDASNELQTLSVSNDSISISDGNSVAIPINTNISINDLLDGSTGSGLTSDNVFLGDSSGASITNTAHSNVGLGQKTLTSITHDDYNTAIGYKSLYKNRGTRNTAIGYNTMLFSRYWVPSNSLYNDYNVAIGAGAMEGDSAYSGSDFNTAIGRYALKNIRGGGQNTAIGNSAGMGITTGDNNIFIGHNTLFTSNGSIGWGTDTSNFLNIGNSIYGTGINSIYSKKIGIGTSTPTEMLDVYGNINLKNSAIIKWNGNSNTYIQGVDGGDLSLKSDDDIQFYSDDDIIFKNNSITNMVLNNQGRLSLGGSYTPSAKLDLDIYTADDSILYAQRIDFDRYGSSTDMTGLYLSIDRQNTGGLTYGIRNYVENDGGSSNTYGIYSNVSGTSTLNKYGFYTYVDAVSSQGSNYGLYSNVRSSAATSKYGIYSYVYSTNGGLKYGVYSRTDGSSFNAWAFYGIGNSYLSGGSWQTSDMRLKKNISSFDEALSKIGNLPVKSYHFNNEEFPTMNFPTQKQYGIMAQDLELVFPEMVLTSDHEIPKENGEESDEKIEIKAVNYTGIIPVTIKAIQEQQEMIKNQQELIKKLEERITQLENN